MSLMTRPGLTIAERIERRTQRNAEGCLIWTGSRDSDGYPKLIETTAPGQRRQVAVHRVYWELVNGPIPEGQALARRDNCLNRRCISPDHLELTEAQYTAAVRASAAARSVAAAANPGTFACGHAHDSEHAEQGRGERLRCGTCHKIHARERCRRWRQRHPDRVKAYRQKLTAQQTGLAA